MAEKKTEYGGQDPPTQDVVKLLKSILEEFREQAASNTPPPLGDKAETAIAAFKEISVALDVKA
jgi:hypothetical protein